MVDSKKNTCATLRPSREAFERPFAEYVGEIFSKHPDWPCFKVIPPKGYRARRRGYDLSKVIIGTPIRQHAIGTSGTYQAILVEQPPMTGAEFEEMASSPDVLPPKKGHKEDSMLERRFWSAVTLKPPLYGADTPVSLFDKKVAWGWNLRNLEDLLKKHDLPDIPGVTSPMTYFGMWRSFFCWHQEDCDLFSVNYLHLGASKVWYVVPPSASERFDSMARQIFPEAARGCSAFMRHKNTIISPKTLHHFGVPYVQVLQKPGEFIVLNAAAYHGGFNMGFNCAEAVNFALEQWADVGRDCSVCECGALPQSVQLDMSIMFPGIYDSTSEDESTEEHTDDEEVSDKEEEESSEENVTDDEEFESACSEDENSRNNGVSEPKLTNRKTSKPSGSAATISRSPLTPTQSAEGVKRKRPITANTRDSSTGEGSKLDNVSLNKKPRRNLYRKPRVLEITPMKSQDEIPKEAIHSAWGKVLEAQPVALVNRDPKTRELNFELVHRLQKSIYEKEGVEWVGLLEKSDDGLYHPVRRRMHISLGASYPHYTRVRLHWVEGSDQKNPKGGWAIKTKPKLVLM